MISKEELIEISRITKLNLYQQEKDYLLKLFLFNYYKKFEDAIFKGGTCIKYLFGFDRFSEDLDFVIKDPKKFKIQVDSVLKEINLIGIETNFKKEELFEKAYTSEISFKGPLFNGSKMSLNKIKLDAGHRLGLFKPAEWNLISSEYAETPKNFLVKTMSEEEMLVEKIIAIFNREKGRDLFDVWFLLKKGVKFDEKLLAKKKISGFSVNFENVISKNEYENEMSKLTNIVVPYDQIIKAIKKIIN